MVGVGFEITTSRFLTISDDNLVDGKKILYLRDTSDITLEGNSSFAQVLLTDCSNIMVKDFKIEKATMGIYLGDSDNCNIVNNTLDKCTIGIELDSADQNNVINNSIFNCIRGISLMYNSDNHLQNNSINACLFGVIVAQGWNIVLENNKLKDCGIAITLAAAYSGCKVLNNTIVASTQAFIALSFSTNTIIKFNLFKQFLCDSFLTETSDCSGTIYANNTIELIIPESTSFITENQTITTSSLMLQWTPVSYASEYEIYQNGTLLGSTSATSYEILFSQDGIYYYEVIAKNMNGISPTSRRIEIIVNIKVGFQLSGYSLIWLLFFMLGIISSLYSMIKRGHFINNRKKKPLNC
jgi:parallel beta-helix repeat protein